MNNNSLDTRIQHAVIGETNNAGKTTATDDVPLKGEIIFNSTLNNFRIGIGGNTPYSSLPDFLHVFTGANTSHAGTSGLVLAPSQKSSGDPDKFLCDDGSWKAVSSSGGTDTTYKFYLNGTLTYGSDSGGTNLSSPDGTINGIYAPTTSGTSGNMLKSNGNNNAPTWDSLENIIGKKTANYVLAGNGTASGNGVVSWQQLSLSSLSDAPNTGTLTLNGTGFSVYSPTASLSKTWYAPEGSGSQYALLTSGGSNTAPIWTLPTGAGVLAYSTTSGSEGWSFKTIANIPQASTVSAPIVLKSNGNSPLAEYGYLIRATDSREAGADSAMRFNSLAATNNYYPRLVVKSSFDNPISLYKQGGGDPTSADGTLIHNKIIHSSGLIPAPPTSSDGNKYLRAVISSGTTTFGWKNGLLEIIQPGTDYLGHLASHPQGGDDFDQLCVPQTTYVGSNGAVGFFRCINGQYGRVSFQGNLNQPVLVQQGIPPTYSAYTTIENKIITSNGLINAPSTANRYLKWTGSAFTWDTAGSGTVPGVASVNGDNPGLLQVTSDVDPDKVYINEDYSTAIPVFYSENTEGTIEVWKYDKGEDELPYSKGEYVHINRDGDPWQEGDEEYRFEGHYVNIHDIVNSLIRNRPLLALLKDALDNYKPE